ncbi:MAG: hemagglutinin, partial [Prevotella salivae]|nr:hemagglutinin [Segatella salivae]
KEQAMTTTSAKATAEKHKAEYEARVKPQLASFEEQQGLENDSLSFTGKTKGTAAKRLFELSVKGQKTADGKVKTIWVVMAKDGSLFLVEKANEKPKTGGGTTEQPNFGIKHKNQP